MVKLFGASDDLVLLEGSIDEELEAYNEEASFSFSDGTLGSIKYDGTWCIEILHKGEEFETLIPSSAEAGIRSDGTPCYSDVLIMNNVSYILIRIGDKNTRKYNLEL